MKKGQLTVSTETALRMAEVFEANEPVESAVVLRLAAARERRRLARSESRVRRRYAWGGALAMVCFSGSALGLAVKTGYVKLGPLYVSSPAAEEERSSEPNRNVGGPRSPDESEGKKVEEEEGVVAPTSDKPGQPRGQNRISNEFDIVSSKKERARDAKGTPPQTPTPSEVRARSGVKSAWEPAQQAMETETSQATHWEEVAGAMRKGEDARAREAITPLTASDDPETRDSAELVQLRIELGSHQSGTLHATSSQRARLSRLAKQGASATIRASARRLMQRLAPLGVGDFRELEK